MFNTLRKTLINKQKEVNSMRQHTTKMVWF